MKAQLEQHGLLHFRDAFRSVDPNPLADDFREGPLTPDAPPNEPQDLGQGHGPMLQMERPTELLRERNGRKLARPDGGRLDARLTYW